MIAGQHDRFQAQSPQAADGRRGAVLQGIGDRDEPRRSAVDGDENGCLSLGRKPAGRGVQRNRVHPSLFHKPAVPD